MRLTVLLLVLTLSGCYALMQPFEKCGCRGCFRPHHPEFEYYYDMEPDDPRRVEHERRLRDGGGAYCADA